MPFPHIPNFVEFLEVNLLSMAVTLALFAKEAFWSTLNDSTEKAKE